MDRLRPPPWVIAHRGDQERGLENGLRACAAAPAVADMLEIDVRLTADGELVVFHDRTLARLAGLDLDVESTAWERLARVELVGGERISTLDDLLEALPADFPLNVELKRDEASRERLAAGIVRRLDDRPAVVVSSFDHELLEAVRGRAPAARLAPIEARDPRRLVAAGRRLEAWSLHAHRSIVDEELVAAARRAGRFLLVFTVNDEAEVDELFGAGVDGVFADHPARLSARRRGDFSRRGR